MPPRVLACDDDEASCRLVKAILTPEGFEVSFAHDGEAGLARAASDRPDLVVLDLDMPKLTGIEVLERLHATEPALPIIMLTGRSDVQTAVRATKLGAFDYLTKPVDPDQLVVTAKRASEMRALRAEVSALREQVGGGDLRTQMGHSAAVQAIAEQVETVAPTQFSVLLLGETGTGKEVVAQALHRRSDRRDRPFIALDCGAIPENLLESELFGHERGAFTGADRKKAGQFHLAEGGTLFLDEVGNLPLGLQSKLLRVLESRQLQAVGSNKVTAIDVRFIAATNDNLQERAVKGGFRADLFFRLAQYTVRLPPLRERSEDIEHLAARFLREVAVELRKPVHEIAPDAVELLKRYPWPGNVRELRNVMRQAVLESKGLSLVAADVAKFLGEAAPSSSAASPSPAAFDDVVVGERSLKETADEAARAAERLAITTMLRRTNGNKSQAARALKTDYKTLHLKMKSLGIRGRDFEV
jgi:DNA-binding NtrC family response regulator